MGRIFRKSYPLRTLIISINLIVLLLPIIGIASLRIFENVMYRQTEAKLASEGAYVHSIYMAILENVTDVSIWEEPLVRFIPDLPPPADANYTPYPPTIDLLKDEILPVAPAGIPTPTSVHPAAIEAGEMLQPILKHAKRFNLSGVRVLDFNGTVIATNGGQVGDNLSNRIEVKEALSGRYSSVLRRRPGTHTPQEGSISRSSNVRVYVAIPMMERNRIWGIVYLHRTSLTFFDDLWQTRYTVALITIVLLTLSISLLLSYVVTRPLKKLISQAHNIASGDSGKLGASADSDNATTPGVSLDIGAAAPIEAHQLSQSLSLMLEQLEGRYRYVEEFTKNFSHEFKTPLTSIQGAIEILQDNFQEMNDEERERFMSMIDKDVKRMERLLRRLIELTRIEISGHTDAEADLGELLQHMTHRYNEAGNDVRFTKETEQVNARISIDMAEIMFVNLIDNAVTHGTPMDREKPAVISVILKEGPIVEVRDNGPGISSNNLPQIFDRFFTTARERGGTGLGLAMVKAIADAYSADLSITSDEDGTTFTVRFFSP